MRIGEIPVEEPSKFQVFRSSTDSGFFMRVCDTISTCFAADMSLSYHCLGADAVVSIDPDVLRHDLSILREIEVLLQLYGKKTCQRKRSDKKRRGSGLGKAYVCSIRDDCGCACHFGELLIRDLWLWKSRWDEVERRMEQRDAWAC